MGMALATREIREVKPLEMAMAEKEKKCRPSYLKLVHSKTINSTEYICQKEKELIDFDKPPRSLRETMHRKGVDLKTVTLGIGALCIMCASIVFMMTILLLAST